MDALVAAVARTEADDQARAAQETLANRPLPTRVAYASGARQYRAFCDQYYHDVPVESRYTVCEESLFMFLNGVRTGTFVTERNGRADRNPNVVSHAKLKSYACAVVDLYRQQKSSGCNDNPHPRSHTVTCLLKSVRVEESTRNTRSYADRAAGTEFERYRTAVETENNLATMLDVDPRLSETALRGALSFVLSRHAHLPQESLLSMKLPDLQIVPLKNEGPQDCFALVLVLNEGRTNEDNMFEACSAMRYLRPLMCPMGILAMYFFCRFQVRGEAVPGFQSDDDWHDIPAVNGHSGARSSLAHASTGAGGASDRAVRRMGHLSVKSLERAHLACIPRASLREDAGFPPEKGRFFLTRASVLPPESLQRRVFPWVEEKLALQRRKTGVAAAVSFLTLCKHLRIVLLQDSVIWRRKFPRLSIWQHAIFASDEYRAFSASLQVALDGEFALNDEPARGEPESQDALVRRALPVLATTIQRQYENIMARFDALDSKVDGNSKAIKDISKDIKDLKGDGKKSLSIWNALHSVLHQERGGSLTTDTQRNAQTPPVYTMLRGADLTILQVWREWHHGRTADWPSIVALDQAHGSSWRSAASENRFYRKRKTLIGAIGRLAERRSISKDQAAQAVENMRVERGKTVDFISKNLSLIDSL